MRMAKRNAGNDITRKNCKVSGWQNGPPRTSSEWQKLKYIRRGGKRVDRGSARGNRVTLNKLEARRVTKFPYFGYSSGGDSGRAAKLCEKLATLHRLWKHRKRSLTRTKSQAKRVKYKSNRSGEWLYYYVSLKRGFRENRNVSPLSFSVSSNFFFFNQRASKRACPEFHANFLSTIRTAKVPSVRANETRSNHRSF